MVAMSNQSTGFIVQLQKQCQDDSERWFGDTHAGHSLVHQTLALAGEVGELANIVKKIDRKSLDISDAATRIHLAEECADILTYLLNVADLLQIDLEQAYHIVRGKNEKRFMAARAEREAKK